MALEETIKQTQEILEGLRNKPHWFLAFSGGKDSTALLIMTVEFLRWYRPLGVQLEVLYADTRLEIPPMARHAANMLEYVRNLAIAKDLPIRVHSVRSPLEESFWVLMLGKGYPAPGFRFRWCTDRLKVRPMNRLARSLATKPDRAVILVGVREGESRDRDRRLRAGCGRGECGPAAVGKASIFPAAAPIRHWQTCEIWHFLAFVAPSWGWPTGEMWKLYGNDERVRYGCWVCPLVRKDRAMEIAIAHADGEQPVLEAMASFRERLIAASRSPENRELRPNGRLGRLTWGVRRMLFQELLSLQVKVKQTMIEPDEVRKIIHLWKEERNGL